MQEDRGLIDEGELVEAGGRALPLLEQVESSFDDVAAAIAGRVQPGWGATLGTTAFAVSGLVSGFGDHGDGPGARR